MTGFMKSAFSETTRYAAYTEETEDSHAFYRSRNKNKISKISSCQ